VGLRGPTTSDSSIASDELVAADLAVPDGEGDARLAGDEGPDSKVAADLAVPASEGDARLAGDEGPDDKVGWVRRGESAQAASRQPPGAHLPCLFTMWNEHTAPQLSPSSAAPAHVLQEMISELPEAEPAAAPASALEAEPAAAPASALEAEPAAAPASEHEAEPATAPACNTEAPGSASEAEDSSVTADEVGQGGGSMPALPAALTACRPISPACPARPCFWCLTPPPATPPRDLQQTEGGSVSQAQPTAEVDQGPPATTNDQRLRPTEVRRATAGPVPSAIYSDKGAKKAAQSARRAARRAAAEAAAVAAQVFSAQVSVLNEPT
jgi:hypothetical protein